MTAGKWFSFQNEMKTQGPFEQRHPCKMGVPGPVIHGGKAESGGCYISSTTSISTIQENDLATKSRKKGNTNTERPSFLYTKPPEYLKSQWHLNLTFSYLTHIELRYHFQPSEHLNHPARVSVCVWQWAGGGWVGGGTCNKRQQRVASKICL